MTTHDVVVVRGDDWDAKLRVRWLDADSVAVPIVAARMQVRAGGGALLLSLDDTSGLDIVSEVGTVIPTLTAAETAALEPGTRRYDIEVTSAAGQVKTLVGGAFTVAADVTYG